MYKKYSYPKAYEWGTAMKKSGFMIFALFVLMLICSCGQSLKKDDFFAMDTYMNISLEGEEEDVLAAKQEVFRIDAMFGFDGMDKENPEVSALINEACRISEFTKGSFDITVAPLMELWGFRDKEYTVPEESEIEAALKKVGYNKALEDVQYDFGAVAKGYASDRLREILIERDVKSAIISLGGNVVAIGSRPDGQPWKVGIKSPSGQGYAGYVKVKDTCVVTSGGYERYFESMGKRYSHIMNPKTGYPADSGVASVTLVCENGVLADALSTAFYVMGEENTKEFYKATGGKMGDIRFSVIIIGNSGNISVLGDVDFTEGEQK